LGAGDESEDLKTGVTEHIFYTDRKTPSSKHFLNKRRLVGRTRRNNIGKTEIPSGPLDKTLFNLSRAKRTYQEKSGS